MSRKSYVTLAASTDISESDELSLTWRYRLARARQWLVRCRSRQQAERLFTDVEAPTVLSRPFAGGQLYLDVSRSILHQMLYLEGERLIQERYMLRRLLRAGMRVVDIGANIGYYVLLVDNIIGPTGHITAIEPSPENVVELKKNILNNQLKNVSLIDCAVGAHDGRVGLRTGINSGVVDIAEGAYSTALCPLDCLISDRVDFVKIDVDGYEGLVLDGSRKVLERHRPILFLELHPLLVQRHGSSIRGIVEFLSSIYSSITFFDVPEVMSLAHKCLVRYGFRDCVRQVNLRHLTEEDMHRGRVFGTFWAVCR